MNVLIVCFLCSLLFLAPEQAYAYIDAGTGSIMLQLLVAGVAGLIMFMKIYWRRLVVFFKGFSSSKAADKKI